MVTKFQIITSSVARILFSIYMEKPFPARVNSTCSSPSSTRNSSISPSFRKSPITLVTRNPIRAVFPFPFASGHTHRTHIR